MACRCGPVPSSIPCDSQTCWSKSIHCFKHFLTCAYALVPIRVRRKLKNWRSDWNLVIIFKQSLNVLTSHLIQLIIYQLVPAGRGCTNDRGNKNLDGGVKMLAVMVEVCQQVYWGGLGAFCQKKVAVWTIYHFRFLLWLLKVVIHVWQIYTHLGKKIASVPLTATGQRNNVPVG